MPELLSDDELTELASGQPEAPEGPGRQVYQYVRPLAAAADDYLDMLLNDEGRWMFGIRPLDAMIRGTGRGELTFITGKAHSGKTQLALQSIANNPDKRVVLFTPDEVDALVLSKLVSVTRAIPSDELEKMIQARHEDTVRMVRRVAEETFSNLVVQHDSLTFEQMEVTVKETEQMLGGRVDAVFIDYLELLPGEGGYTGLTEKSQALKRWAKMLEVPVICLHQASRSSSARGESGGMEAMRYGGDTEAMHVLEVYRKKESQELTEQERAQHEELVTVNIVKNKRPPCLKGEIDLHIHPTCGQVREL